jgi:hypothetical protein
MTALHIRLDRRHMTLSTGSRSSDHYLPALLALDCVWTLAHKNLTCASASPQLVESLTSFWPVIWSWIQLMRTFLQNEQDFPLLFRLHTKNVLLSILRFGMGYKKLDPILRGTPGIVSLIFEIWNMETKAYDFDPSNPRYFTTPAALTLDRYFPPPSVRGDFDWHNAAISAGGGSIKAIASVALTHLRHDAQQTTRLHTLTMDLRMLSHLSFHLPIRHALLSQHSVLEITRVAVSLSSQKYSTETSDDMGACLSGCFIHILQHLTLGDVWTWTIQSLDGQLLRAIIASEPWQTQMHQNILLYLLDAIIKNLTTRLVTLATARAVKKVRTHGLEDRFLNGGDEPLRRKWSILKELVEERVLLIPWDDESRHKNHLKSCDNHIVC